MNKRLIYIVFLVCVACGLTACKDDVETTGQSVLDRGDAIIVLADTFAITSNIDSCDAIISQADSFLLGEVETKYGLLRASILTQLACPEGYHYPEGFTVDSVDSVCLFMYYSTWVGDGYSPLAVNAYLMDRNTFDYSGTYRSDLNIEDYCSRDSNILTNYRIIAASEKLDSIKNSSGNYIPMVRMRLNDDFTRYFASIQTFESQKQFNEAFKGLLIETSFGSSTVLNITDIALGVFYHFSYNKAGKDTTVSDMKAFYANSEVRTVNHIHYQDKDEWIEELRQDSDTYNYIIAPAGVYTHLHIPMTEIADTVMNHMVVEIIGEDTLLKRPYVNKAEVRVEVTNVFTGSSSEITSDDWLQPASYMLLIREESVGRFFKNRELPTDTCALLSVLTQGTDSLGDSYYYYSYDLSGFITNQLRQEYQDISKETLDMVLIPVTVGTSTTTSGTSAVSSVRQQQTISATEVLSAKNGMELEIVYSGF